MALNLPSRVGFKWSRPLLEHPPILFVADCRPKAKKALQKLAKDYPRSPLPHRYLVSCQLSLLIRGDVLALVLMAVPSWPGAPAVSRGGHAGARGVR